MLKKFIIIFGLFSCFAFLTACNISNIEKENKKDVSIVEDSSTISDVKDTFDIDIYANHLDELYDGKNILYSPLSLNMALGMLQEGANGSTLTDISNFLQKDNYGTFAKDYILVKQKDFESARKWKDCYFDICNSLWIQNDFVVKDTYQKSLEENYFADTFSVDYKDKETVNKINDWISEKTKERIPEFLNDIDSETLLTLVNTIYFEDEWAEIGFEVDSTFTSFNNEMKNIKAARFSDNNFYYENNEAIAFSKKYSNDLYFLGILPKETSEFNLSDLNISGLLETETKGYDVKVTIPKFEFESMVDLNKLLFKNGLSSIFTKPDLSGISEKQLVVSQVVQGCNISFDEKGTTAAAATAMMLNKAAMPEYKEVKELIFDRPFAFMIYDRENNEVIFIGKVIDI